ncbi:NERD domain-containing protein [Paenibacillus ehimensis]|uniref:NERD domain-containing protein n=1 Tax=Paenibacillus ehimensis TaxID=79264 RepID=UPI00046F2B0A|nr:NERD domain-containing protein [Paenibacillus ehimensis]
MIWIVLAIMIVATIILNSPTIKGMIGEKSVTNQLNKLNKEKYIILNDVTIPSSSGKTTQLDHVVISTYGIFVIETKNYRGWIVGDEKSEYWTQVIYKRKERLYNPLRQNYGHVMALKGLLSEYSELPFIPIVCFSFRADLKVKVSSEVIYTSKLVKTIKKYNQEAISASDVKQIAATIGNANITNKDIKKQHVKSIKLDISNKRNKISNDECPKCGGSLVLRNGKFGQFKGCSNYPKCRFVNNSK